VRIRAGRQSSAPAKGRRATRRPGATSPALERELRQTEAKVAQAEQAVEEARADVRPAELAADEAKLRAAERAAGGEITDEDHADLLRAADDDVHTARTRVERAEAVAESLRKHGLELAGQIGDAMEAALDDEIAARTAEVDRLIAGLSDARAQLDALEDEQGLVAQAARSLRFPFLSRAEREDVRRQDRSLQDVIDWWARNEIDVQRRPGELVDTRPPAHLREAVTARRSELQLEANEARQRSSALAEQQRQAMQRGKAVDVGDLFREDAERRRRGFERVAGD
jgi:hypothetical protein